MINKKTAIQHIDDIINSIERLIKYKEDFSAFILIALAIEYLGSFIDEKPFDEYGHSEIRFKNGVELFKESWYKQNQNWMYKNFRGPLIHQFWTGSEMLLTSVYKNNAPIEMHLKKDKSGKRVFVLEEFFKEFKSAAMNFINKSKKENSLNKDKQNKIYTEIKSIEFEQASFSCSGTTMTEMGNLDYVMPKKQKKNI